MHRPDRAVQGVKNMHDLLIALAFIGMVVAPAIVAANGEMFGGYLPPAQLLDELRKSQRQ